MQLTLTLNNINGMYTILEDLRNLGYQVNQDFEFSYTPGGWSLEMGKWPATLGLNFKNPSLAAWAALKYS